MKTADLVFRALLAATSAACASGAVRASKDGGGGDALTDVSTDVPIESDVDSATDAAGDSSVDSGLDATSDVGADSSLDSGVDSRADSAVDSGADSAMDSSIDSGADSAMDSAIDTSADSSADSGDDSAVDPPVVSPLPIIVGDEWPYFKGTEEPTPLDPLAWTDPAFDDSAWPSGPSGYGYGTDCAPFGTTLDDMTASYVSLYTRRAFYVDDPASVAGLVLSADVDDGFVAYINGIEVARNNVSGSPPTFGTFASADHECSGSPAAANPAQDFLLDASFDLADLLVPGTNVLAVQTHNLSIDSSDFTSVITLRECLASDLACLETALLDRITRIPDARTLRDLALLRFAVFSDNKGYGPNYGGGYAPVATAVERIHQLDASFVLGMGDNLQSQYGFLEDFIMGSRPYSAFWRERFWPNVADGENDHWMSQGSWGRGKEIWGPNYCDITNRGYDVEFPDDPVDFPHGEHPYWGVERDPASYYVPLTFTFADAEPITIHLFQLTFPDTGEYDGSHAPPWVSMASNTTDSLPYYSEFRPETRQFLTGKLEELFGVTGKGPRDITVIGAGSVDGRWIHHLNESLDRSVPGDADPPGMRQTVLDYGDLAMAGTVHSWFREARWGDEILEFNSGQCIAGSGKGFTAAYVFDNPVAVLLMYTRCSDNIADDQMYLDNRAFLKFIESGHTHAITFDNGV